MTKAFFEAIKQEALYIKKEGTQNSYYWFSGSKGLPNRVNIERTMMQKDNLLHPLVGLLTGKFKTEEKSPLKRNEPFRCRTQIWQRIEYPLMGYGVIAISNKQGKITGKSDTGDLIIFCIEDINWEKIRILFFPQMVMKLDAIITYLTGKFP